MKGDKSTGRPIYDLLSVPSVTTVTSLCMTLSALEREWRALVGDRLALRTAPHALEGDVLVVTADGPAVLQDLNFKKSALVRKIRTGARIDLRDIRVELGSVARKPGAHAPRRSGPKAPPRAARVDPDAVESLAAEILSRYETMSPELARTIARCR
ncbi:DUF721 domain-containing protein, partial [Synergistaceae bacterium OttesenSCG-928-I11]|nr:DUF721 domain-containing protein [Synergistaceae bacterium OttesenSCG-928-I11]